MKTSMKRCKGPCARALPVTDFHYKNKARGTRQNRCKSCMSEYGKKHYLDNRQEYIERAKERLEHIRTENTKLLKRHLSTHPCVSCGQTKTACLRVSIDWVTLLNSSPEVVSTLLASCEVKCLNCRA